MIRSPAYEGVERKTGPFGQTPECDAGCNVSGDKGYNADDGVRAVGPSPFPAGCIVENRAVLPPEKGCHIGHGKRSGTPGERETVA
jgi:hypothetical protein